MLQLDGLMEKEGKGGYGWLQGEAIIESHFVAACTGMTCRILNL